MDIVSSNWQINDTTNIKDDNYLWRCSPSTVENHWFDGCFLQLTELNNAVFTDISLRSGECDLSQELTEVWCVNKNRACNEAKKCKVKPLKNQTLRVQVLTCGTCRKDASFKQ